MAGRLYRLARDSKLERANGLERKSDRFVWADLTGRRLRRLRLAQVRGERGVIPGATDY